MESSEFIIQRFCDGAIAAGYLFAGADAGTHNRVQDEVAGLANLLVLEHADGSSRLEALLLHDHRWVQYYAACALLKADVRNSLAASALGRLALLNEPVASKAEVSMSALQSLVANQSKH